MHFEDLSSFLHMGGYGLYVWLSFAAAAISLALVWGAAFLAKQQWFNKVLKEQHRQARIHAAKSAKSSGGEE